MTSVNAERTVRSRWGRWWQERTAVTLVVAAVLILGMGALRPGEVTGLYVEQFWMSKTRWRRCADVVVTGDSRVGIGISPEVMEQYLPGRRVVNYGFNANGYSSEYLRAVGDVLDPLSRRRMIVLGISPRSLTPSATGQNFFKVYGAVPDSEFVLVNCCAELLRFVEPMSFNEAIYGLFPEWKKSWHYRRYGRDGWIASSKSKIKPNQKLDNYQREFENNPVAPGLIEELFEFVRRWRGAGIEVVGFRPPSSGAMVELENRVSGFDEAAFAEAFAEAGGLWIGDLDQGGYLSFDGSHLDEGAARELSGDLARKIAERGADRGRQ